MHESGGLDQRHSRNVQAVKLLSYSGTSPWLGAVRMTGKRQRVAARKDVLHSAACRAYELKYARKKVCVCVCVCLCVCVCARATLLFQQLLVQKKTFGACDQAPSEIVLQTTIIDIIIITQLGSPAATTQHKREAVDKPREHTSPNTTTATAAATPTYRRVALRFVLLRSFLRAWPELKDSTKNLFKAS